MPKKIIKTDQAPAAIGPYEQGICIGDFLFTSGQIALDPKTGNFLEGTIEEETELVIKNIEAILTAAGLTLKEVVKCTVYLTDLGQFGRVNQVYERFFGESKPARACVQVAALPKGAKIEMDAIAVSR
jgi:2-iminobutanoate/2-iminopropanoate deaminase